MWTIEHTEQTSATPAQLWARYAEPARWPEWVTKPSMSPCKDRWRWEPKGRSSRLVVQLSRSHLQA